METINGILGFLNNPLVKGIMVFLGTFIAQRWPKVVNEAAAFWTGIYSIGTALLGALLPGGASGPTAMHGGVVLAGFSVAAASVPWWQSVLGVVMREGVLPWIAGYGAHRAPVNAKKFASGVTIMKPGLAEPVETKPFQATLTTAQERKLASAEE